MLKKIRNKNPIKIFFLVLPILILTGCFSFSFQNTGNIIWNVPNTDLTVMVQKFSTKGNEVRRTMTLSENYSSKNKIELAKGLNEYSRINIYQIYEDQYVLTDVYETYLLNTKTKTLTKTSPGILSATFEDTRFPKFIGAFDDNESGNWRYIPASERNQIPLTTK